MPSMTASSVASIASRSCPSSPTPCRLPRSELLDFLANHFATEERLAQAAKIEFFLHGQEHGRNLRLLDKAVERAGKRQARPPHLPALPRILVRAAHHRFRQALRRTPQRSPQGFLEQTAVAFANKCPRDAFDSACCNCMNVQYVHGFRSTGVRRTPLPFPASASCAAPRTR